MEEKENGRDIARWVHESFTSCAEERNQIEWKAFDMSKLLAQKSDENDGSEVENLKELEAGLDKLKPFGEKRPYVEGVFSFIP